MWRDSEKQRQQDRTNRKQVNGGLPGSAGRKGGHVSGVCGVCLSFGVVEKDLPRKTVSLVVALVSPTLLEATHSYMASSRGVRKG